MHCYKPIISLNSYSVQIRVCHGKPKTLKSLFETQRRENLFLISLLCSSRTEASGMDTGAQWGLTHSPVLSGAGCGPWRGAGGRAGGEGQLPAVGVRVLQHHGEHLPGDTRTLSASGLKTSSGTAWPRSGFTPKQVAVSVTIPENITLQRASRSL